MSLLYKGAREFGIDLEPVQLERFEAYYHHLVEWNARFNLTAITGYTEAQVKHFLDSLSVARALPREQLAGKKLIDVGAGAGFPGMPLAIAFPNLQVTLLEATGKRVRFLDELVRALALENVRAIKGRAEELAHTPEYRERYDFATARAVADLPTLVEYTLPFVRVGGIFIASKSAGAESEVNAAAFAIDALGGQVRELVPVHLPTLDETRYLVVIEKVTPTPRLYPRQAGLPRKKPL